MCLSALSFPPKAWGPCVSLRESVTVARGRAGEPGAEGTAPRKALPLCGAPEAPSGGRCDHSRFGSDFSAQRVMTGRNSPSQPAGEPR